MSPVKWTPVELFEFVNRRIRFVLRDKVPADIRPWDALFPDPIPHILVRGAKERDAIAAGEGRKAILCHLRG